MIGIRRALQRALLFLLMVLLLVLLLQLLLPLLNLALAGLMSTGTDENKMGTLSDEHRILVIGKSGNGKSSLCNTLCGSQLFETGRGLSATTRTVQMHDVQRYGYHMRVVDTPDVTNLNMDHRQMEEEVARWRQFTQPFPTAVLLAVRCDVRYTAEEHTIYRQIQRLWGDNSLTGRLVVAFTFGDRQDSDLEEELKTVCPELKSVLRDAGNQYVMFTNKGPTHDRERQVQQLLNMVHTSPTAGHKPSTPKQLMRALAALFVISGLCFAASLTANKSTPAICFGLLCLGAGVGVIALRIKDKMQ